MPQGSDEGIGSYLGRLASIFVLLAMQESAEAIVVDSTEP
jgi:hypothetical protein